MDIDTRLSDQEMEPFDVGLRQAHVEHGNTSGSKGRRSCGECNDEIKLGCWCVMGEGGGGRGHRGDIRNNTTTKGKCTSLKAIVAHVHACHRCGSAANVPQTCAGVSPTF